MGIGCNCTNGLLMRRCGEAVIVRMFVVGEGGVYLIWGERDVFIITWQEHARENLA